MIFLYYNSLSDCSNTENNIKEAKDILEKHYNESIQEVSSSDITWSEEVKKFKSNDKVIIAGGDGTLNYFINHLDTSLLPCEFYFYALGTGNDFLNDVKEKEKSPVISLNSKVKNLPTIEVKGKRYKFINGIGYGIDGECCVKAEEMKKAGASKIDYSSITISLLFKSYVARNAKVKVDGKEYNFKNVYLASSMFGRYYGGGMKIAPDQDRNSNDLTFVTVFGMGKLRTLMLFPKIFKGEHIKDKKHVFAIKGKEIEVTFDKPCGLQIDGEVVDDVTTYKVKI